jgi:hypothetical protein
MSAGKSANSPTAAPQNVTVHVIDIYISKKAYQNQGLVDGLRSTCLSLAAGIAEGAMFSV